MINRTAFENELFSHCQSTTVASARRTHAQWSRRSSGSERSGSSCRATRRERVWQGNMSEKLLTVAEAATTLRLHPVTLRALAAAGGVPAFKLGRAWRFVEIDLLAWARAHYRRADAVGDKESTCRSTNVQIAATGGPRSAYRTEAAYAALVAPRTARKHRNGSTACAPNSGASTVSANVPSYTWQDAVVRWCEEKADKATAHEDRVKFQLARCAPPWSIAAHDHAGRDSGDWQGEGGGELPAPPPIAISLSCGPC